MHFSFTVSFLSFSKYSFCDSAKTAARILSSSHSENPAGKKVNSSYENGEMVSKVMQWNLGT